MLVSTERYTHRIQQKGENYPFPVDFAGSQNLQVVQNILLVQHLLQNGYVNHGFGYAYALDDETIAAVGLTNRKDTPGVDATPYGALWKPGKATMSDLTHLRPWQDGERAELISERMGNDVKSRTVSWHGFLGSKVAMYPWMLRLLEKANTSDVAAFGLSWKGAEGTSQLSLNGSDPFSFHHGIEQIQTALVGIGQDLGISQKEFNESLIGLLGHSYGGLIAFRHMLRYGNLYANAQYSIITPVVMGARIDKQKIPLWFKRAADEDENLWSQHVYVLDGSPYGRLVRAMGTLDNEAARETLLQLGEDLGIIQHILRYYIGEQGLGGEDVLPVYQESLWDRGYARRDVRLLDSAPMIVGDDTVVDLQENTERQFAIVLGGKKERRGGDTVLAREHTNSFINVLENVSHMRPVVIRDERGPHHPHAQAMEQLFNFTLAALNA